MARGGDTSTNTASRGDSTVYSGAGRGTDAGGGSAYRGNGAVAPTYAPTAPPIYANSSPNYGYGAPAPANMGAYNAAATGPFALNTGQDEDAVNGAGQRAELARLTQMTAQNPVNRQAMLAQYAPGIQAMQQLLQTPGVDQDRIGLAQRFLANAMPLANSLQNNTYANSLYGGGQNPQQGQMLPPMSGRPQFNPMIGRMPFGGFGGGFGGYMPPQQPSMGNVGFGAQMMGRPSMNFNPLSMLRGGGANPSQNPYAMSLY